MEDPSALHNPDLIYASICPNHINFSLLNTVAVPEVPFKVAFKHRALRVLYQNAVAFDEIIQEITGEFKPVYAFVYVNAFELVIDLIDGDMSLAMPHILKELPPVDCAI